MIFTSKYIMRKIFLVTFLLTSNFWNTLILKIMPNFWRLGVMSIHRNNSLSRLSISIFGQTLHCIPPIGILTTGVTSTYLHEHHLAVGGIFSARKPARVIDETSKLSRKFQIGFQISAFTKLLGLRIVLQRCWVTRYAGHRSIHGQRVLQFLL